MKTDFLIVGGGIAGVSAAARLSHLGQVVLLEAEDHLAHHASGRSAALYEPGYGRPAVLDLTRESGPYLHGEGAGAAGSPPEGGVLSPRGLMIVAAAHESEAFAREIALTATEEIGATEACARVPILNPAAVAKAAFSDRAWDIDTDRLLQSFAREARGNGAEIVTGARVTAIAAEGTGWRVTSAKGEHAGAVLVDAAGPWADEVARMAGLSPLGLRPYRRSMARIPAPGGRDPAGWPMIFGAGESWYAKPDAGALIVSPAEEDPAEPHDAWPDDMVLAEGLARYEAMVREPVTRLLSSWAGLRTFAPDRVLVIGPDPRAPNFLWSAGQGGYGFQTAPAASALLADLAAGRPPRLAEATVAALSPARLL